jgi:23S rRNA (pseudouridine1915-N3)-methyltransferase
MPDWVATATHDYIKRMPADCSIEIKEIKPDITPAKEAVRIAAAIPKGSRVIALDERGKDQTTQNLATQLASWRQEGFDITFLIGGADGLDASLKTTAQAMWRLSSLTLPHAMARVLLVEQPCKPMTELANKAAANGMNLFITGFLRICI